MTDIDVYMGSLTNYMKVSDFAETFLEDTERANARCAYSLFEQAQRSLAKGHIAAFLTDIKIAGDYASKISRYLPYDTE